MKKIAAYNKVKSFILLAFLSINFNSFSQDLPAKENTIISDPLINANVLFVDPGEGGEELIIYGKSSNLLPGERARYYVNNGSVTTWSASGGVIVSGTATSTEVYIDWGSGPSGTVSADGFVSGSHVAGDLNVSFAAPPSAPSSPTQDETCDAEKKHYLLSGTPPTGVTWYWQTTLNGKSKSYGSESRKEVSPGQTWYLSAFDTNSTLWSTTSSLGVLVDSYYPTSVEDFSGGPACNGTRLLTVASDTDDLTYKLSYRWYNADTDQLIAGVTSRTEYMPPGNYYVSVSTHEAPMCTFNTLTVPVFEQTVPTANAGAIQGDEIYCTVDDFVADPNLSNSVSASVSGGDIDGYEWYVAKNSGGFIQYPGADGASLISPLTHLQLLFEPDGVEETDVLYFERRVIYSGGNCTSFSGTSSTPAFAVRFDTEHPTLSASTPLNEGCDGCNFTLVATTSGASGSQFEWYDAPYPTGNKVIGPTSTATNTLAINKNQTADGIITYYLRGLLKTQEGCVRDVVNGSVTFYVGIPPKKPDSPEVDIELCDPNGMQHYLTKGDPHGNYHDENVIWYWQTTLNGKSKSYGFENPKEVSPGQTWYLSAFDTNTQLWSEESSIGTLVQRQYPDTGGLSGGPACDGTLKVTVVSDTDDLTYNLSYQWYDADTDLPLAGVTSREEFLPPGNYYVQLETNEYVHCTFYTSTITVFEQTVPTANAGAIQGDEIYCTVDDFVANPNLSNSVSASVSGGDIDGYEWYVAKNSGEFIQYPGAGGASLTSPLTHLQLLFEPDGVEETDVLYFERRVNYSGGNCANFSGISSTPAIAVRFDTEYPTLSASTPNNSGCSLSSFTLTASTNGASGSEFYWYDAPYPNGNLIEGEGPPTPTNANTIVSPDYAATNNGEITYYLRGTLKTAMGCSRQIDDGGSVTLTIDENLTDFTYTASSNEVCSGTWYKLLLNPVSPNNASISWTVSTSAPGIEGIQPGSGYKIEQYLINPTEGIIDVTYAITSGDPLNSCFTQKDVTVSVYPNHGPIYDGSNCDDALNWTRTITFGENEVEIGATKSYFDYSGKLLQTQTKDIENNKVFATSVVRDKQGRDALTTIPAPISSSDFGYVTNFFEASNGQAYNADNFDVDTYNPDAAYMANDGTLGWYYSYNNTEEPLTPTTNYPYSRTEYYEDGSVKRVASPGNVHRLGGPDNNVTGTFPLLNELNDYIAKREALLTYTSQGIVLEGHAVQQVAMDAEGNMAISITDQDGNAVMSALAGGDLLEVDVAAASFTGTDADEHLRYFYVTDNETTLTWNGNSGVIIEDVWRFDSGPYDTPATLDRGLYKIISGNYKPGFKNHYSNISYNFYDDAGRLKVSISPNGVVQWKAGVAIDKIDKTEYTYNHKGWLLEVTEPDAGTTKYLYRRDGKIRFSQNAQQASEGKYSFTLYDDSGRPTMSGETTTGAPAFNSITDLTLNKSGMDGLGGATVGSGWIKTYYDIPTATTELDGLENEYHTPTHLMGAVAVTENENSKTWYSYDSEGKVKWIVQKINGFDDGDAKLFTIDYTYDYLGNVEQVAFQKDVPTEAFFHHYTYDANQRLVNVVTSTNGNPDDSEAAYQQASYTYYKHGPLKRMVLGKNLQGLDYTYTIEGWLKSINNPLGDPGEDGTNAPTFKDAFGMTLEYYANDYTNAGNTQTTISINENDYPNHYNGNIRATTWNKGSYETPVAAPQNVTLSAYDEDQPDIQARQKITLTQGFEITSGQNFTATVNPEAMVQPMDIDRSGAYGYAYDEKQQLTQADFGSMETGSPAFGTKFKVDNLAYDANGNIESLRRSDEGGVTSDDFAYNYNTSTAVQQNNQLTDIPGYATYSYNTIGQLTSQTVEGVTTYVAYDVTGKVTGVYKDSNHTQPVTEFAYDDRGFRVSKTTYNTSGTLDYTTWYVRDASGNIMATYDTQNVTSGSPAQTELPIYGSGRIGVAFNRTGQYLQYNYELTDQLGNVRSVVSPLKSMAVASMETEYAELEEFEFTNVAETRHTESSIFNDTDTYGSSMARLNNAIGQGIGPARILRVQVGDTIKMKVDARYIEKQGMNNGVVGALAAMVSSALGIEPTGETLQAYDAVSDLLGGGSLVPPGEQGVPKAYLNYLLFDYNYNHVYDPGDLENQPWDMMTSNAATSPETLELELVSPVDGYMYIYVANETDDDVNVYFDNLTIIHTGMQVVEHTDYYPYGMVMRKEIPDQGQGIYNPYRFGYQGQFAEKDDETGWNHFELRQYDSKTGRWIQVDSKRQFKSPYIAFSNNPIWIADPDGSFSGPGDGRATVAMINVVEGRIMTPTNWYIGVTFSGTVSLVHDGENWAVALTITGGVGFGAGYNVGILSSVTPMFKADHVYDLSGVCASAGGFIDLAKFFPSTVLPPLAGEGNLSLDFTNFFGIVEESIETLSLTPLDKLISGKGFTLPTMSPIADGMGVSGYVDGGFTWMWILEDPNKMPMFLDGVMQEDDWGNLMNKADKIYNEIEDNN